MKRSAGRCINQDDGETTRSRSRKNRRVNFRSGGKDRSDWDGASRRIDGEQRRETCDGWLASRSSAIERSTDSSVVTRSGNQITSSFPGRRPRRKEASNQRDAKQRSTDAAASAVTIELRRRGGGYGHYASAVASISSNQRDAKQRSTDAAASAVCATRLSVTRRRRARHSGVDRIFGTRQRIGQSAADLQQIVESGRRRR